MLVPIRIIKLYNDNDELHMPYHKPLWSFLQKLIFFDENYHKRSIRLMTTKNTIKRLKDNKY